MELKESIKTQSQFVRELKRYQTESEMKINLLKEELKTRKRPRVVKPSVSDPNTGLGYIKK